MQVSVIIVTLNRPDCVRECLTRLRAQNPTPDQVIVVDASPDNLTREVVAAFPEVEYVRNENGVGKMTESRNIGLLHSRGDIISFIDDDAFAHPNWLAFLLETYREYPEAGAVGGRALNNIPGEETEGVNHIGKLTKNGDILGYFAADPGKTIEVDHIIGCNMSFRREVLAELGGFREDFLGIGISSLREDSDMSLRVGQAGYKLFFQPKAVVDHIGAPHAKGKRFDWKYAFDGQRNHLMILACNFGIKSPILWRYILSSFKNAGFKFARSLASAGFYILLWIVSSIVGMQVAWRTSRAYGRNPRRLDPKGETLRQHLNKKSSSDSVTDTVSDK
jgi:GT2 family glycosyltransferase